MLVPSKTLRFITAEIAEGTEFKTRAFQSPFGVSDASAFFAHSAVKFRGIVIPQLKDNIIPVIMWEKA
jgi:hypothetical protein